MRLKYSIISILLLTISLGLNIDFCEAKTYNRRKTVTTKHINSFAGDRSNQWGVGLILGDPSGITVKYWQDYDTAWDFAIGAPLGAAGISIHADYLIHLRPFAEAPEAPVYVGGGVFMGGSTESFTTGARGTVGITYLFNDPFDVFFELSPKFSVVPNLDFTLALTIGGRLYF